LDWLRNNIHRYGEKYDANELCEKITGEKLNFKYFMEYVTKKYSDIYNLN
jgi:carboxypeptidase Taq